MIYIKLKIPDQLIFHYHNHQDCTNLVLLDNQRDIAQALNSMAFMMILPEDWEYFQSEYAGCYDEITESEFRDSKAATTIEYDATTH